MSDAGAGSLGPGNTFTIWPWDTFRGSYLRPSNSLHAGMPHFLRIQTVMLSVVLCPLLSQIYTHSRRISRRMISMPPTCWTLDSPSFLCRLDAPPPYPWSPGLYACPSGVQRHLTWAPPDQSPTLSVQHYPTSIILSPHLLLSFSSSFMLRGMKREREYYTKYQTPGFKILLLLLYLYVSLFSFRYLKITKKFPLSIF